MNNETLNALVGTFFLFCAVLRGFLSLDRFVFFPPFFHFETLRKKIWIQFSFH